MTLCLIRRKAHKKLRKYVEANEYAIEQKAEIMVKHFHEQVIAKRQNWRKKHEQWLLRAAL
jgi:hypothetical protein